MERKEALQYIATKLNEGIPRHVIYNELLSKVPYKNDLLSYISEVPDADTISALKTQNRILIGLLVCLFVLNTLNIIAIVIKAKTENIPWFILGGWLYILVPLFLVFIIKEIKNYRRNGYRFIIILTLVVINVHLMGNSPLLDWLIIVGSWLPASIIAFKIMKKTHPYDRLFKTIDRKTLEAELTREGMV
jgi:hypothetical protein